MNKKWFLVFLLLTIVFVACANAEQADNYMLTLSETELSIAKGASLKLTYEFSGQEKVKIQWDTSDKGIVTVNNGAVRGVNTGKAVITCTALLNNEKVADASCTIEVYTGIKSIKTKIDKNTVFVGIPVQAALTILPEDATYKTLIWSSSDETIATVDDNGVITGLKPGKVKITCQSNQPNESKSISAVCQLTVKQPVIEIQLNKEKMVLGTKRISDIKDTSGVLEARVFPDNADNKKVKWESSDSKIAKVSNGKVTSVNPGECTISAIALDGSGVVATCSVIVLDIVVKNVDGYYIKQSGYDQFDKLDTTEKKTKFALYLYSDVMRAFRMNNEKVGQVVLSYYAQESIKRGKAYVINDTGTIGKPITAIFGETNSVGILLMYYPSRNSIKVVTSTGIKAKDASDLIDIDTFVKYLEMDPKEVLKLGD